MKRIGIIALGLLAAPQGVVAAPSAPETFVAPACRSYMHARLSDLPDTLPQELTAWVDGFAHGARSALRRQVTIGEVLVSFDAYCELHANANLDEAGDALLDGIAARTHRPTQH